MSLFEYAQEIVSRKLERKEPMLTISMGMQPVMPMAQGGGLSSVQNSLNINGQPHRLAYINPNEEDLLKSLGGSGRKIDGIPAYYDPGDDSDPDSGDTTGGFSGPGNDSDPDSGDTTGQSFDTPSDPGPSSPATSGYGDTFDMQSIPDVSFGPSIDDPYAAMNMKNVAPKSRSFIDNINPLGLVVAPLATLAKAAVTTANNNNFGMDPMGVNPNVGHAPSEDDDDDGTDAGGDDIIIREKIAAVKQIPVEEVTVEEVQRAKRLTAAQRVTGTRLEDILDDIYGSGKGAGLLGIPTNNTGTA